MLACASPIVGVEMAWTAKARERSIQARRAHRDQLDEAVMLPVLRQVAEVGGGLSRALRLLAAHGVQSTRGGFGFGSTRRITRMDLYRIAARHGLARTLCPGDFVPGRLQVEKRCRRCGADLEASPWCPCIPVPVWTCHHCGEQREWGNMRPCWCIRSRPKTKPQRRLAKWNAARRAVTTRRKST